MGYNFATHTELNSKATPKNYITKILNYDLPSFTPALEEELSEDKGFQNQIASAFVEHHGFKKVSNKSIRTSLFVKVIQVQIPLSGLLAFDTNPLLTLTKETFTALIKTNPFYFIGCIYIPSGETGNLFTYRDFNYVTLFDHSIMEGLFTSLDASLYDILLNIPYALKKSEEEEIINLFVKTDHCLSDSEFKASFLM
jgi:hypothetical protein